MTSKKYSATIFTEIKKKKKRIKQVQGKMKEYRKMLSITLNVSLSLTVYVVSGFL